MPASAVQLLTNPPEPPPALASALQQAMARQLGVGPLIDVANRLAAEQPGWAATLYKTWIACNADHAGLHVIMFNYAVCLSDAGDLAGAANTLREAIRQQPEFGPPSINLGGVLERLGQPGPAVQTWLALVDRLAPVTPDAIRYKLLALKQVGRVLENSHQDATAEDALRQSLELDPHQPDVIQHLVALRQRQCKWPALVAAGSLAPERLRAALSPLSAAYHADDPLFHLATAAQYARHAIGRPRPRPPRLEPIDAGSRQRRLRIGYVSSDLRDHAVGFGMTEVMELHDRTQVEVHAYYCGIPSDDETHRRTIRAVDRWTDLTGLDDDQADQAIRRDQIDILVDLNGYTKDARTKVFALRPAPIAVNWFGFPGSMATPYHHYIVADAHVIPPEHDAYYSERVLRLPCYQPNDRKRRVAPTAPTRAEVGLPEHGFVFCCLNGMQKLTAPAFARWMTILHRVPGSVLWLLAGTDDTNDRLRAAAVATGIDPARLVFAGKRANPDHLARMPLADLFLDTFPYGAHTTASDALWMGLPVLALQGRSFAARVCASLVTAAGTPDLVCTTAEHYVGQAVALAQDPARLAAIRARLVAGRDSSTLFDTPALVRALEGLYRQMHEARLDNTLPRPDLHNLERYHEIASAEDLPAEIISDDEYRAHYLSRLTELDAYTPLRPDSRLWTSPASG